MKRRRFRIDIEVPVHTYTCMIFWRRFQFDFPWMFLRIYVMKRFRAVVSPGTQVVTKNVFPMSEILSSYHERNVFVWLVRNQRRNEVGTDTVDDFLSNILWRKWPILPGRIDGYQRVASEMRCWCWCGCIWDDVPAVVAVRSMTTMTTSSFVKFSRTLSMSSLSSICRDSSSCKDSSSCTSDVP